MFSTDPLTRETTRDLSREIESELNPAEAEGVFRDSRRCAALALAAGAGKVLLSPPTPRPKR